MRNPLPVSCTPRVRTRFLATVVLFLRCSPINMCHVSCTSTSCIFCSFSSSSLQTVSKNNNINVTISERKIIETVICRFNMVRQHNYIYGDTIENFHYIFKKKKKITSLFFQSTKEKLLKLHKIQYQTLSSKKKYDGFTCASLFQPSCFASVVNRRIHQRQPHQFFPWPNLFTPKQQQPFIFFL